MKVLFIILGLVFFASEANAVSANGNATVVIQKLITVTETTPMDFGDVYSNSAAGDVTLTPAGGRSSGSSTQYGSSAAAGEFTVHADPNVNLNVSVVGGTLSDGANNITLDTMTYTPTTPTTSSTGDLTINTGGTIDTNANQASGTYTGTYGVTVDYQ